MSGKSREISKKLKELVALYNERCKPFLGHSPSQDQDNVTELVHQLGERVHQSDRLNFFAQENEFKDYLRIYVQQFRDHLIDDDDLEEFSEWFLKDLKVQNHLEREMADYSYHRHRKSA